MPAPILKVDDHLVKLICKFNHDKPLDHFSFKGIERDLKGNTTPQASLIMGLAHILSGRKDFGIQLIKSDLNRGDSIHATYCCSIFSRLFLIEEMNNVIYDLADKFNTKELTFKASSVAYILGKISIYKQQIENHIRLLSEDEGRSDAMKFKEETLNDMALVYEKSGCSAQQYDLIGKIVFRTISLVDNLHCHNLSVDISGRNNGDYVVNIGSGASSSDVALLNKKLADAICMEESLEGCNLVARFTCGKKDVKGMTYAYNQS